jgi:hypothetical protein
VANEKKTLTKKDWIREKRRRAPSVLGCCSCGHRIGVVTVVLPIIGILIVVLYGWRSWEIAKEELEKVFKAFADSLAKSFEK